MDTESKWLSVLMATGVISVFGGAIAVAYGAMIIAMISTSIGGVAVMGLCVLFGHYQTKNLGDVTEHVRNNFWRS